jgi:hypothetical protein
MARMIEERWVGIGFDVVTEHLPVADDQGRPVHDQFGLPKLTETPTLVLIVPLADGQRVVRIPFAGDAKQELVRKLTGGIVVPASNGGLPS